jgi:hypothetical protein
MPNDFLKSPELHQVIDQIQWDLGYVRRQAG